MLREARDIVVFGVGGLGRGVHQVITDINAREERPPWRMLGWLDDDPSRQGSVVQGHPVLGDASWLQDRPETVVAVGIGAPAPRERIAAALLAAGHRRFATLVHPMAWVADRASVGEGSVVMAGATVNTDARVGRFVVLNMNSTVGHDARLADFVTVLPSFNVGGNVTVGEGVMLGAGGAVVQGKEIGARSTVGAGGVVIGDVPPDTTVVGVPAKPIDRREGARRDDRFLHYRSRT